MLHLRCSSKINCMSSTSLSGRSYIILFVLAVIWGSSFILIKKALIAFDPIHLAAMRLVVAGGAFLPILAFQWKKIDWSLWRVFLIVSITGSGIPAFMFFIAQTGNLWYGSFVLVATVCYGISVNMVKNYLQAVPSLVISSVTLAFSGVLSFLYLLTTDVGDSFTATPEMWHSLWALILLALASTFFATILFYRLVKDTSAVFASTITYLIPIVAFIWGWFDGEALTILHLLGMVLILLGVWIIKKK